MEIITIVLDGKMTHQDRRGNKSVVRAGEVQGMSAGTGPFGFNLADRPVHFYQIWIFPDEAGLRPSYGPKGFASSAWRNQPLSVASGQGKAGAVDATFRSFDWTQGSPKDWPLPKTATGHFRRPLDVPGIFAVRLNVGLAFPPPFLHLLHHAKASSGWPLRRKS